MKRRDRSERSLKSRFAESGASRWRALMAAVMVITGASGFLASYTLLHLGVHSMGVRYPVAVLLAYLIFLAQIGTWVSWQRHRRARRHRDWDLPDATDLIGRGGSQPELEPGGGSFGGAGA
ncbi:MAG: hypothetical protein ABIU84_14630, partial [Thermoanaerobaculia bacterium]